MTTELLAAARAVVAMTFGEARAAFDAGRPLLYCDADVLNPCFDNRPNDKPGVHWGGGKACSACCLRAEIAAADKR